jgi:uncharacterized membrane protein YhhN
MPESSIASVDVIEPSPHTNTRCIDLLVRDIPIIPVAAFLTIMIMLTKKTDFDGIVVVTLSTFGSMAAYGISNLMLSIFDACCAYSFQ